MKRFSLLVLGLLFSVWVFSPVEAATVNADLHGQKSDGNWRALSLDANGSLKVVLGAGDLRVGTTGTKHDGYIITDTSEVQTTNATQTTLEALTLLDENTYHVEALVIAVQSDGTDRASYHIATTVYRTAGGNATIQGTVTSLHTQESNASLAATFTVSGSDVRVSVTGIAAETWEWGSTLTYINMSN